MMPEPCGRRLIAVRSVSSSTRSSVISQRRGKGLFRALRGWRHIIAPPIAAAMTSETKDDAAGVLADVRDRKSVVSGKSVSVRVDLGGRGLIKTKKLTRIQFMKQH